MFSKFIKGTLVTTLVIGLFTFQVNSADAATKVMWGKTELKVGQIGKVTILEDVNLVSLNSDGTITGLRTLEKGEEYRVYQYKGQHGGLYGVGAGSFVQNNETKVKYETPSKAKLEQVNGKPTPPHITINPTNPGPSSGISVVPKPADPVTQTSSEKVFNEVLSDKYEVKDNKGLVTARIEGKRVYSYINSDKNYFNIDDLTKVSEGYKIMKQLGLPLTEFELKELIKKSNSENESITKGKIYVNANNHEIDIRW